MKGKILLFAGGATLLYLVSRAKAITETVRFLEYTPGAVALKFEGLAPVLHIRLDIYNPNRTSVPVTGIIGRINYKGKPVASFTNTDRVNVNGNETTSVNMKVRLSLFNTVVALLTKDPVKVVEIDGLIKTAITDIPFGYGYDLSKKVALKKAPAVSGRSQRRTYSVDKSPKSFVDAFHPDTFHLKRTA